MRYFDNKEDEIVAQAQDSWKRLVEETNLEQLVLDKATFIVLRQYHQLAYLQGQKDMLEQIQEIYDQDVDLFVTMFENEEDCLN